MSEQNQEWLRQQVASGKYHSIDDVLDKARQILDERDQALAEELADMEEKVRTATGQADSGQLIPADAVFDRILQRNAKRPQ